MKSILIIGIIMSIVSCSSFYEFSSITEEKEMFRSFKMKVGKDSLEFNAYKDYYHDTINLDVVYLTSKELKKLKNTSIKSKPNQQILFLHNDTPYYLNIIGYFYPNLYLSEVKQPKFQYQPIPLTQGIGFEYTYEQKQIADYFLPYGGGILRFMAIGNPVWAEKNPDRFTKELGYLFYVINSNYFKLKPTL